MSALDFDSETLPWVDRPSFPQESDRRIEAGTLDLATAHRLMDWRHQGFLYLPGCLDGSQVDAVLTEYETSWEERPGIRVLVEGVGEQDFVDVAPRSELHHHHFRLLDFHDASPAVRQAIFHPTIVDNLRAIFDQTPVAMQSLFFEYGSEQATHQDFPYVQAQILSHLVGCWIALEDVGPDNGPLFYYPGSHRLSKYDWGDGSLRWGGKDYEEVARFEHDLSKRCDGAGLERLTFHAKKGDVFLWHAALAHGGSPVVSHELSRKSLVAHFSTREGYPRDRRWPELVPAIEDINGGVLYRKPKRSKPGVLKRARNLAGKVVRKVTSLGRSSRSE